MPSHALVLEPVNPVELSLQFTGARAALGDGLMLLPATRISLDLDWDGAELQLAAGDGQVALEITPFVIGGTSGGGSGNGYFPGGW